MPIDLDALIDRVTKQKPTRKKTPAKKKSTKKQVAAQQAAVQQIIEQTISQQTYADYPFYVVHKTSGKVDSGWDYREDAQEALDVNREAGRGEHLQVLTARGVKRKFGGVLWGKQGSPPQGFKILGYYGSDFSPKLQHGSSLSSAYRSAKMIGRGRIVYPVSNAAFVMVGQGFEGRFDVFVFKDDEPGWTVFYSQVPKVSDAVMLAQNFYKDKKHQARVRGLAFERKMRKYQAEGQKQGQLGLV